MNRFCTIFLLILFLHSAAEAALSARWTGVAGVVLSDGKKTLLFDPVFTKPSVFNWLFNTEFRADSDLVGAQLKAMQINRADAIFISHTHFDHSVDTAEVAAQTGAIVYGGDSLKNLVLSQSKSARFIDTQDGSIVKIGAFTVHTIRREHAPVFGEWKFQHGPIAPDFSSNFYQYKEGETWSFYIEHPDGNVLIDQGSRFSDGLLPWVGKVDFHFAGVANKLSVRDVVENNIMKVGAKKVYPLHFDFFFFQSSWLENLQMPGVELERIERYLKELSKKQEFILPKRNELLNLTQ